MRCYKQAIVVLGSKLKLKIFTHGFVILNSTVCFFYDLEMIADVKIKYIYIYI